MPIRVCPHCHQEVAVREQRVRECPHCRKEFYVQLTGKDGSTAIKVGHDPTSPQTTPVPVRSEVHRKINGPAIGLMVAGGLTTLMGLMFLPTLLFPELMGQQLPWDPVELMFTIVFMIFTLVLGIVTIFGANKMLQLQSYPLAMAAAIAAMVPCYCCFLGLPMGIWALIVLNDEDVKRAFK